MKSLKKIISLAMACSLALSAAACSNPNTGGGGSGDDTFGGGAGGKTVVRFYSFNNTEVNAELKKALEADFYVKNPDIYIQTEISTGSFYTNLLNDFAGNVEADVFGMEPGEIYPFLSANYLEPLDSYFEASETISLDDIWEINKLVSTINNGECSIEFIYQYRTYFEQMWHCVIHSKKKPYYRECQLHLPETEATFFWNDLCPDREW